MPYLKLTVDKTEVLILECHVPHVRRLRKILATTTARLLRRSAILARVSCYRALFADPRRSFGKYPGGSLRHTLQLKEIWHIDTVRCCSYSVGGSSVSVVSSDQ